MFSHIYIFYLLDWCGIKLGSLPNQTRFLWKHFSNSIQHSCVTQNQKISQHERNGHYLEVVPDGLVPFGEGCWVHICFWLVSHDSLVMFMLSKIYVPMSVFWQFIRWGTGVNISYKSIRIKKDPTKTKEKIRTNISKPKNTDLNRCSFFINQHSTTSTKYAKIISMG